MGCTACLPQICQFVSFLCSPGDCICILILYLEVLSLGACELPSWPCRIHMQTKVNAPTITVSFLLELTKLMGNIICIYFIHS